MKKKNYLKYISIFALFISISILIYVFYKSEIINNGKILDEYIKYYILSFALVIASITFVIAKNEVKEKIFIFLVFITLSSYFFESLILKLNLNDHEFDKIRKRIINEKNFKFDVRSTLEIYNDLKKKNDKISLKISPREITISGNRKVYSLSGLKNRETIYLNYNGYYPISKTDRFGFNNNDNVWDSKNIEFLIIGDDFAQGIGLQRKENFALNIEKLINKNLSVVNLGQNNNGPLTEYATLREYLPIIKTKRILIMYYEGNDLKDLKQELNNHILSKYLNDFSFSQNLVQLNNIINDELEKILYSKIYDLQNLKKIDNKDKIVNFVKLNALRTFLINKTRNNQKKVQNNILDKNLTFGFKKIINLMNSLATSSNAKFYFVYLPGFDRYSNKQYVNYNLEEYDQIIKILDQMNINYIDLHKELFEKTEKPLELFSQTSYNYYNAFGNNLVSKIIIDRIKEFEN